MTTPDERLRAMKNINFWLHLVVDAKKKDDRKRLARNLLRHYPGTWEIEEMFRKANEKKAG